MGTKDKSSRVQDLFGGNLIVEKVLVTAFFASYILFSQVLIPLNSWQEIFPFFHWNLFSGIEPQFAMVRIRVYSDQSSNSCYIEECTFFNERYRNSRLFFTVQNFAAVLKDHTNLEDKSLQFQKNQLGRLILAATSEAALKYELVLVTADLRSSTKTYRYTDGPVLFREAIQR